MLIDIREVLNKQEAGFQKRNMAIVNNAGIEYVNFLSSALRQICYGVRGFPGRMEHLKQYNACEKLIYNGLFRNKKVLHALL